MTISIHNLVWSSAGRAPVSACPALKFSFGGTMCRRVVELRVPAVQLERPALYGFGEQCRAPDIILSD